MESLYIWGRGKDAARLLSVSALYLPLINGVIDSAREDIHELFYGLPIYTSDEINWNSDVYVIIATRKYYDEISSFLLQKGKSYLEDFCDFHYAWNKWRGTFRHRIYDKRLNLFLDKVNEFEAWIDNVMDKVINNPTTYARYILAGDIPVENAVLACCVNEREKQIELHDATIEYDSIEDLSIIFHEILIREDYYFVSKNSEPYIIDCGANIGLAIYYFKHIYPHSRVIAFEPNPMMMQILNRNVKRNCWSDVELHQIALCDSAQTQLKFYIQKSGIAGSLERRNFEGITEDVEEITVTTDRLENYISDEVDYLKMDVEGSETKIIRSLGEKIKHINNIFIEFHDGKLKDDNSISYILSKLEESGFSVIVSKSLSSSAHTEFRTMQNVGKRVSEVIWGKRDEL